MKIDIPRLDFYTCGTIKLNNKIIFWPVDVIMQIGLKFEMLQTANIYFGFSYMQKVDAHHRLVRAYVEMLCVL